MDRRVSPRLRKGVGRGVSKPDTNRSTPLPSGCDLTFAHVLAHMHVHTHTDHHVSPNSPLMARR